MILLSTGHKDIMETEELEVIQRKSGFSLLTQETMELSDFNCLLQPQAFCDYSCFNKKTICCWYKLGNEVLVFQDISLSPETTGKQQNENFNKILSIYTGNMAMIAYQFLCLKKVEWRTVRMDSTNRILIYLFRSFGTVF